MNLSLTNWTIPILQQSDKIITCPSIVLDVKFMSFVMLALSFVILIWIHIGDTHERVVKDKKFGLILLGFLATSLVIWASIFVGSLFSRGG